MRLYELSKMDGAIVVSPDFSTIHYANAYLHPDADILSGETGMRHLAAHRTSQQCDVLTLSVSERRSTVTLYLKGHAPQLLDPVGVVLEKAEAALTTLEKFTGRLRQEIRRLTTHEYENSVSLKEVIEVLRTFEHTVHITEDIEAYITELGEEGRLIRLQLEQSTHWIPEQHENLLRDYVSEGVSLEEVRERLQNLRMEQLSDDSRLAKALGYSPSELSDETVLKPRGYRQLSQVPRLPERAREQLVEEFGFLQDILKASKTELTRAEGVGRTRARAVKRALERSRELQWSVEIESDPIQSAPPGTQDR
jgi:diadenylate cyclase